MVSFKRLPFLFFLAWSLNLSGQQSDVEIANNHLAIRFDAASKAFSVHDRRDNVTILTDATFVPDGWESGYMTVTWKKVPLADGAGIRLELYYNSTQKDLPEYRLAFELADNDPTVIMKTGLKNTVPYDVRYMNAAIISNAALFPGATLTDIKTLDSPAGFDIPAVQGDATRHSHNAMLFTGLVDGQRRTVVWGGLRYENYYVSTEYRSGEKGRTITLRMQDPVGRKIAMDEEWWAPDTYYLNAGVSNPFLAMEGYGLALREANHADPNAYSFPTLCGWSVAALSGGKNINNAVELVNELDDANTVGLTRYTPIAVRLEPDTYWQQDGGNTVGGWWDDEHVRKYGFLTAPYDTYAKWAAAVRERNGIPFTYYQPGMPSDDFAKAHPHWMLHNDISQLHVHHRHHQPLVRYDYTDTGFRAYVLDMWKRMRRDGVIGIKFDYPETLWNYGGFDDGLASTTSVYRGVFQLARQGLGPEAWLHERHLGESGRPITDVTAGIVDLQRTAGDDNRFLSEYVTTAGLRWYKHRSVFLYYPDGKALHIYTPEVRKSLLTLLALTSGRLELSTRFGMLTPEMVHEISRTYPAYDGIKSPRPLDAFTHPSHPQIYDLPLTEDWHQVALFNGGENATAITLHLGKPMVAGGMELDPDAHYYVYDFWNDRLIGKLAGSARFDTYVEPMEHALYSVRKVEANPQLISTNRHILQGWMDTKDVTWKKKTLSGKASVTGGEAFKIVIATNGRKIAKATAEGGTIQLTDHPAGADYKTITLESPDSKEVGWAVVFN
ncbi:hypothetical protein [Parapedobacter soli]|uniref:hypothetical protein n=1 Tax=Parapedobacter soli TaxID=416955 RepID=UPI0021C5EA6D|nr:hypothetical protein [Parapedobacter soli]